MRNLNPNQRVILYSSLVVLAGLAVVLMRCLG